MKFLHTKQQPPEILAVRTAAKTAIFEVQQVDLRFSNGQERNTCAKTSRDGVAN